VIFAVANPVTGRVLPFLFFTDEAAADWIEYDPRAARYPNLVVVALSLPN
jgi:hypothetical protein